MMDCIVHCRRSSAGRVALQQFVQRVGPGGVDDGQARDLLDQAQFLQFENALPKAEQLPRFPPGTMIQSGLCQSQRLEDAIHDALLPFEAEGVDAVHQVDAELRHIDGDLADAPQAIVKIAVDLQGERAVIQRLAEFPEARFSRCR